MAEKKLPTNQQIIDELLASEVFSGRCSLQKIPGGAVNKSYQLVDNHKRYFVKAFNSDEAVNLNRQQQFVQLQQLAIIGLAPKPCYLSRSGSFQVDAWVEGQSLLHIKINDQERYRQLAQTLAIIHKIENVPELNFLLLDLPAKWQEYIAIGKVKLTGTEKSNLQAWTKIWYGVSEQDLCVCHNDLSLQHVLAEPDRLIFDWEYAAYTSRYFDIASSLLINQASNECELWLLTEYARTTGIPLAEIKQKVNIMKPLVKLTNKLWFAAAGKLTNG